MLASSLVPCCLTPHIPPGCPPPSPAHPRPGPLPPWAARALPPPDAAPPWAGPRDRPPPDPPGRLLQPRNRGLSLGGLGHLDKAVAPRAAVAVCHDLDAF